MRRLTLIPVCFVLAIAACGDDEEADQPATTPQPETEEAETPSGGSGAGGGGSESVGIVDFKFDPETLTVSVGTEVEWTNEDSADHNVIFDGDTPEDIDNLSQGQSGTVTFDEAGTFDYVCSYHPGMEGSVEVQ